MLARLAARLGQSFQCQVHLGDLLSQSTIAEQARFMEQRMNTGSIVWERADRSLRHSLSDNQQRLWYLRQRNGGADLANNMVYAFDLHGQVQPDRLAMALTQLIRRHEALRTQFTEADDEPQRQVQDFAWINLDYRQVPDLGQEVDQVFTELAGQSFDLARPPLFKAALLVPDDTLQQSNQHAVLILCMHHIIADGWSVDVILRDLDRYYRGENPDALTVQGLDYSAWLRSEASQPRRRKLAAFWSDYLRDAPECIALPLDRTREPSHSLEGHSLHRELDATLTEKLRLLASQRGSGLYQTLAAAFMMTLAESGAGSDIVTGAIVADRTLPELEHIVDFLANTIALRGRVDGQLSVKDNLDALNSPIVQALEHQDYPFNEIVKAAGHDRSEYYMPVIQTACVYQNVLSDEALTLGEARMHLRPQELTTEVIFDLCIQIVDRGETLDIQLDYASSLFNEGTAARLLQAYTEVLRAIAMTPQAILADLQLFAARPAVLQGRQVDLPAETPRNLWQMLARTARRYPSKGITFIEEEGESQITYDDLVTLATKYGGRIRGAGVAPTRPVIVLAGRFVPYVQGVWGAFYSGAVPVTVAANDDYSDPEKAGKLIHAWETLGKPLVLADSDTLIRLAPLLELYPQMRAVDLEMLDDADVEPADPESAATAFYQLSAGSTGKSKCIDERHESLLAFMTLSSLGQGYVADQSSLNWLPFDHIGPFLTYHLRDIFLGRNQTHVANPLILDDPLLWMRLLSDRKITHTWSPNFGYKLVTKAMKRAKGLELDLSHVVECMNGGEAVSGRTIADFRDTAASYGLKREAITPSFGMAECCTCITYGTDRDAEIPVSRLEFAGDTVQAGITGFASCGRVIPGVGIRIVADDGTILKEYQVGRFQISGPTVTRGYLNLPEVNAASFTDDGWFDTGDNGFVADGCLYLTGRSKEVLIVNGVNYVCHDLEERVEKIADVEPTFVAALSWRDGEQEAVAICYVPRDGADLQAVNRQVRETLIAESGLYPAQVVPVTRSRFLKTTSGKIQRLKMAQALADGSLIALEQSSAPANVSGSANMENPVQDEPGVRSLVWNQVPSSDHPAAGQWRVIGDEPLQGLQMLPLAIDDLEREIAVQPDLNLLFGLEIYADPERLAALLRVLSCCDSAQIPVLCALVEARDTVDAARLYGLLRSLPFGTNPSCQVLQRSAEGAVLWPAINESGRYRVSDSSLLRLEQTDADLSGERGQMNINEKVTLITGGAGGLARHLAVRELSRGNRVILLGRGQCPDWWDSDDAVRQVWIQDDMSDMERTAQALAAVPGNASPDRVFHLAGVYETALPPRLEAQQLIHADRPKSAAVQILKTALENNWPDSRQHTRWILFGSVAGMYGDPFAASYASANGALLGMADTLRGEGWAAHWLGWSNWTGVGMGSEVDSAEVLERGLQVIELDQGMALLDRLYAAPGDYLIGIGEKQDSYPHSAEPKGTANAIDNGLDRHDIVEKLTTLLEDILDRQVQPEISLFEQGGGSIEIVRYRRRIQKSLEMDVDVGTLIGRPTVLALADYLFQRYGASAEMSDEGLSAMDGQTQAEDASEKRKARLKRLKSRHSTQEGRV